MLVAAAAETWQVPAGGSGRRKHAPRTRRAGAPRTAEMVAAAGRLPANPPLKTAAQFTFIGRDRSTPRVDSPSKCNGTATYTIDVKRRAC
jgi:isoquinoline 1-oxidoreductase beta subunit